jgi:TonB family protein
MKLVCGKALVLGMAVVVGGAQAGWSQADAPAAKTPAQAPEAGQNSIAVDVVGHLFSEDQSNLRDYWPALQSRTKDTWLAGMPAEAEPPQLLPATVSILCVVHTDGSVSGLVLEQRSGKIALDRAARAAILRSAPYDAFPSGISTAKVRVRFTFRYNGGAIDTPLVDGVARKPEKPR